MECEIYSGKASVKARRILDAMACAAASQGITVRRTTRYTGSSPWYMTWGLGHPERRIWTDRHLAGGGHVIAWDLAYWDRARKFRLTIDADHPYRLVRDMPETRLKGINLREDHSPDGHIVVIGMGRKSVAVYDGAKDWESLAVKRAKRAYPGRKVIVRPKGLRTPIEAALRGASMVVCRHSNVAIDACVAGVPVVCEDGIGRALYSGDISNPIKPTPDQRLRFLHNVAWWQWAPSEASDAWRFISDVIRGC